MPSTFSYFNDAMMATLQATSDVANTVDQMKEKKSQRDLRNKSLQLEKDLNDFSLELEQRGDWENWNKDIDDFFQKRVSQMKDKNSPYYCDLPRTAERFQNILGEAKNNYTYKVGQMVIQHDKQQAVVDFQNSLEVTKQLYYGQARYDKDNEGAKQLLNDGTFNPAQYDNFIKTNYIKILTDMYTDYGESLLDPGINAGKTENEIWADIDREIPALKLYGKDGLEIAVDTTNLKNQAKKDLESKYNARVKDTQSRNNGQLSEIYTQMRGAQSAEQRQQIAAKGRKELSRMTGLQLDPHDRKTWAIAFDLVDIYDKSPEGINSVRVNNQAVKKLEDWLKINPKKYMDDWVYGRMYASAPDAKMAAINGFVDACKEYGLSDDEIADLYNNNQNVFDGLIDYAVEKVKGLSDYEDGFKNLMEMAKKEIKTNVKDYPDTALAQFGAFVCDTISDTDWSKTDYKDISVKLQKAVGYLVTSKDPYMALDKKGNVQLKIKNDKDLQEAVAYINKNDFVFTDSKGKDQWLGNSKKVMESTVIPALQENLAGSLGLSEEEAKNITWDLNYHDNDATPDFVFTYGGKEYQYRPLKDKKGKVTDFEIIQRNYSVDGKGKISRSEKRYTTGEEQKKAKKEAETKRNEEDRAARAKVNEAKKGVSDVKRRQEEERKDAQREYLQSGQAAKDNELREIYMKEYGHRDLQPDELETLGITQKEWNKLSPYQKAELILKKSKENK